MTAAAYVNIMQPYFPTFVYALPKRSSRSISAAAARTTT